MTPSIRKLTACAAFAALAAAGSACTNPTETDQARQRITGNVDTTTFAAPVVGVRAVRDGTIVASAPIEAGGSFHLDVPTGDNYRIQVVTREGAIALGKRGSGTALAHEFDVCAPQADYSVGAIRNGLGDGTAEGGDPSSGEGGEGDCDDPEPAPDGSCWPTDPCEEDPEWCGDPPPDPCEVDPEWCDEPPPPCDPTFPDSCEDWCEIDPASCDPCMLDPEECWPEDPDCPYDDPACWPEPPTCEDTPDGGGMCEDPGCYADQEVPDFGCG